jgi:ribosomal protein S18 acetylase RimI-like enzyme
MEGFDVLPIKIIPFQPEDQEKVRVLILDGLAEHWGYLDESKNPDLEDISRSYAKGVVLVAWLGGKIVGTGSYIPRSDSVVEIVRMSVSKELRCHGIGRQILRELCRRAFQSGFREVILETTKTWQDVISFYQGFGFKFTHFVDNDAYFSLDLQEFFDKELYD